MDNEQTTDNNVLIETDGLIHLQIKRKTIPDVPNVNKVIYTKEDSDKAHQAFCDLKQPVTFTNKCQYDYDKMDGITVEGIMNHYQHFGHITAFDDEWITIATLQSIYDNMNLSETDINNLYVYIEYLGELEGCGEKYKKVKADTMKIKKMIIVDETLR